MKQMIQTCSSKHLPKYAVKGLKFISRINKCSEQNGRYSENYQNKLIFFTIRSGSTMQVYALLFQASFSKQFISLCVLQVVGARWINVRIIRCRQFSSFDSIVWTCGAHRIPEKPSTGKNSLETETMQKVHDLDMKIGKVELKNDNIKIYARSPYNPFRCIYLKYRTRPCKRTFFQFIEFNILTFTSSLNNVSFIKVVFMEILNLKYR